MHPTHPAHPTEHARRSRLPSLTGLRFFAALFVFLFHMTQMNSPLDPASPMNPFADQGLAHTTEKLFSRAGYLGVSFFFVLSGFVLTWVARPGERLRDFYRRRLLKIFPNHLVTWVVAMVLFAGATVGPAVWASNLALVNSWYPRLDINLGANPPSWSLCSELLFYLLFPFALRPVLRIAERRLWMWAWLMVAGTVAVALVGAYLVTDTPRPALLPVSPTQFWFGYFFPPLRMFEFVLGMLLARIVVAGRWPRIGIVPAVLLVAASYAATMVLPFQFGLVAATVLPVGALISAVATADVRGTRTLMRGRTMQWLGEVSFGFYLCQAIVLFYGRTLLDEDQWGFGPAGGALALLGACLLSLLAGWLLMVCVERPAMRRWSGTRRAGGSLTVRRSVPAERARVDA
ncbi:acyltransferase family protein [Streptomyces albireticuli]|uniref:acyltransferase family protein n=1 Tax=Streptomyces albireticuli TaxID=1940 RepID=UPI0036CA5C87